MSVAVHPVFAQHGTFEGHVRLGRKKRDPNRRTVRLEDYVDEELLPPAPPHVDYVSEVPNWPMYDNDVLGDCTCAAVGHMEEAWSFNAGHGVIPPDSAVDLMYWETGDPPSTSGTAGGPTDDGRDEPSVLDYWQRTGLGSSEIAGWAEIDLTKPGALDLLRSAVYVFGGVYTGAGLPITAQGQSVWKVVGDPATDPNSAPYSWGGHAIPILRFTNKPGAQGMTVITWGAPLRMTLGFFQAYFDEAYAVVSKDWLEATGLSVTGLDLAQLLADLQAA